MQNHFENTDTNLTFTLLSTPLNFAFHLSSGSRGCSQIMTAYAYTLSCAQLPVKLKLRNVGHEAVFVIMTTYVLTCTQLAVTLPPWRGVDILEQVPWYPCNVYQQPVENIPQWLHAANEHHLYTPNQMQDPSTHKLLLELWEFLKIRLPVEERKAPCQTQVQLARTRTLLDPR